ncbi:epoxide hydrolase N-terminal domain-containing protein [Cupriavidus sp. 2MCAB6]
MHRQYTPPLKWGFWLRRQGVQLAKVQALVRYWETGYDWRDCSENPA